MTSTSEGTLTCVPEVCSEPELDTLATMLQPLDEFVRTHPQIKRSKTTLSMSKDVRPALFAAIDDVRYRIASSVIGDAAQATRRDIQDLEASRKELAEMTHVERCILPSNLEAFCNSIYLGSTQPLFADLLSYVQGTQQASDIVHRAALNIDRTFDQFSLAVYEAGVAFRLLTELRPRRAWRVACPDGKHPEACPADSLEMGAQQYNVTLRIPEAVFECEDGLVAIKFELSSEIDFYDSKPLRRRDFSSGGDTRGTVGRRLLLLYRIANLDAIPVIADRDREFVHAPTAVVGVMRTTDIDRSVYALGTLARIDTLSPRKGALLVAKGGCADRINQMAHDAGVMATAVDETQREQALASCAQAIFGPGQRRD